MGRCIVQIYEVQTPHEAEVLVDIGVDHVGSVLLSAAHWKQSQIKAVVDIAKAASIKSSLIPLFGDTGLISRALDYYQPDIVHYCEALTGLHGHGVSWRKAFDIQQAVRNRFPNIKAMRAIPIAPSGRPNDLPSLDLAKNFEEITDFFLTDTLLLPNSSGSDVQQPVSGFVGITGQICDWGVAAELVKQSRIPVILAGGISPDNVAEGMMQVRPYGVDSCTCTNAVGEDGKTVRFKKDMEKVRKMVAAVRQAEHYLDPIKYGEFFSPN